MTSTFNEMYLGDDVRQPYAGLDGWMRGMSAELKTQKQAEAEALFRRIGITFAVYGEGGDPDRLIPFDMFPRVFTAAERARLERGIKQRARGVECVSGRCLRAWRDRAGRAHSGPVGLSERRL